jgi:hypothetical protein
MLVVPCCDGLERHRMPARYLAPSDPNAFRTVLRFAVEPCLVALIDFMEPAECEGRSVPASL